MSAKISTLTVHDLVPFGPGGDVGRFYALRLSTPEWDDWKAGQYVMLRPVKWGNEMPWPRPFSICMLTKRDFVIFFQVLGRGTERLAELQRGDKVQVVGPLGTSFAAEPETPTLLIAGGVGIAPFVAYVQNHPSPWTLHLNFGHRLPLGCYPYDNFTDRILVDEYQDNGPEDLKAFIDVLDANMADKAAANGLVLACGPTPMLKTVQQLALKHKVRTQLSLENKMACGVGACLGCVVQPLLDKATGRNASACEVPEQMHKEQPVSTCTCGPVFWADSIKL